MEPLTRFHDGYVTGICLRDEAATVYLKDVTGAAYQLLLDGLEALHVEDFRQDSITLIAEVVTGRAPDADTDFDGLFIPPHPSADGSIMTRTRSYCSSRSPGSKMVKSALF